MKEVNPVKSVLRGNERKGVKESLQSLLLFLIPILFIIPLYVYNILQGITAYYIIYSIYIVGSIGITKYNGRKLHEIGLSRKNLPESLLISCALVLGKLIGELVRSGVHISPELTLSTVGEQALYNFMFSGLGQEILFRGLILFSIWRWKGPKVALVVSTVLFGIMHARMGIGYILGIMIIGGFYGYVVYKTKNIVGPIIAHGLYNFLFDFLLIS